MPSGVPLATYRLQLSAAFGFDAAAALVPYLKSLGISHLYASPFLTARAGSTHGYNIVDHNSLNPEFGGEEAFARLSAALAQADIGLILDFVPNHMGIGQADNAWWLDVLEWGEKSPYARAFDIAWETLPYRREGGVLLPILGRTYGDVLEGGEIRLAYDAAEGSFSAWYYEHRLPIRPDRYGDILRRIVDTAGAHDQPAGWQLLELSTRHRGPRSPSREEAPAFKAALAAVEGGAELIEHGLSAYAATPDDPSRVLALHRLLERQHYRLAHWRVAVTEINYRRFFDINELAGIRVEDRFTFTAVHRLVSRLIAAGHLHGIRLDHIDGLQDPMQYCRRLARLIKKAQGRGKRQPFYVVVEKILAEGEALPRLPGVAGTTGYEWLNVISRVLVDDVGLDQLDAFAREITGNPRTFAEIFERAKLRVVETLLASEFTVLVRLLARIAAGHWRTRDFTVDRLRAALQLVVLHFPVYRTYVTAIGPSEEDRRIIGETIDKARAEWFGADFAIFDFLQDVLTLDVIGPGRTGYSSARVKQFTFKFQQFTGPMMAKSMEDTAFYRHHRLIALNEVGGEPLASGLTAPEFHAVMEARAREWPHGMTATATHDTKRGEDARARILALSELPDEWRQQVENWTGLNARLIANPDARAPTAGHEYMLYQALIGAWPLEGVDQSFIERMQAYAIKAAREGKVETSWTNPNEDYETALTTFVKRLLDCGESSQFIESFEAFARRVALLGALNSLTQVTLKAAMPGVPDLYQGTEFWDLSLVDPDNRRTVDFPARRAALSKLQAQDDWRALTDNWPDGRIKLALMHRLLALRRRFAPLFTEGGYRPIEVDGTDRDNVVAFARTRGRDAIVIAVGRHFASFTDSGRRWPAPDAWQASLRLGDLAASGDLLRAGAPAPSHEIDVGELFKQIPVAVLRATMRQPAREPAAAPASGSTA